MSKRVLITGANGQLGQELVHFKQQKFEVIGLSRSQLDITNFEHCVLAIILHRPDIIIHCAAYTAVDEAESNRDTAFLVNELGTRNMALAAEALAIAFVYISTDYVFNGEKQSPYLEADATDPQTVYGASKLAGEQAVIASHSRYFIVRTSWVFGQYGHNFVKTMVKLGEQKKSLTVVNDQIGSPTYTYDLADFIYELINTEKYGIYHVTNSETCTWYEFAKSIFEIKKLKVDIKPCTTEQFQRPAKRPAYSVLANHKLIQEGFKKLRPWQEAILHLFAKEEQV